MSTHNIGFYEDLTKNYLLIIIKYHQICTLSLLLVTWPASTDLKTIFLYFMSPDNMCEPISLEEAH